MENGNIIYEKRFPHLTPDDYDRIYEQADKDTTPHMCPLLPDFFKNIMENTVRVLMPERVENRGFFIAMAKEFAEKNEIDTVITEYGDRFVAEFRIGSDSTNFGLKTIIDYADDIHFGIEDGTVVVSIIYYTHAIYRNGKKVAPDNEIDFLI